MRTIGVILLAFLMGFISAFAAQTLFPFSISGLGLATNISQCPNPAPNAATVCPVIGSGWMQTVNGASYAPISQGFASGSQISVKMICPTGVSAGTCNKIITLTVQ